MLILPLLLLLQSADCRGSLEEAHTRYEARQYSLAAGSFQSALNTCGVQAQILLGLGQAQLMAQQYRQSLETLALAVRLDEKNPGVLKVYADALYLAGKVEEAETALKKSLSLDPAHEPSLYALGRIYYQENRFPESIETLQKIIAADPKHYRAYNSLALSYAALQRDSEALRHFLRALELVHKAHPEYDVAHANLANFFLERNEYEKAFQLAAEAANRNPSSARNFFLTGKALSKLGKDDLCVRWLEQAVKLDDGYQEAYYLLSRAYRKAGRTADADSALDKFRALSKNPRDRR